MEFIPHKDLGQYLRGPLWTEADTRPITIQLLEGLIIMHNLGITHRGLSPETILVASVSPMTVKIGGFTLSKRVRNNDTRLRTLCGYPAYMSPEFNLENEYTNAVDIWALGYIVHKILTSEVPFDTSADVFHYTSRLAGFPSEHLEAVQTSANGVKFIKSLLEVDPEDRLSAEQARKAEWLCG
ncbi:kinase-like domain-containing protein [Trichophaea hybrida]|nr:kinase-like domain-containing protein [Trichophaea hybrida]